MADENTPKNKSGAGKFFLGAALGAIAGAVAGKAVSAKLKKCENEPDEVCGCDSECKCEKNTKKAEKKEEKKPTEKKAETTETE